MSETFLTQEEIRDLTGRVQNAAQVKVLRGMGIEHRARPDGSIVILRSHVEQTLGGVTSAPRKRTPTEPNFTNLNATRT